MRSVAAIATGRPPKSIAFVRCCCSPRACVATRAASACLHLQQLHVPLHLLLLIPPPGPDPGALQHDVRLGRADGPGAPHDRDGLAGAGGRAGGQGRRGQALRRGGRGGGAAEGGGAAGRAGSAGGREEGGGRARRARARGRALPRREDRELGPRPQEGARQAQPRGGGRHDPAAGRGGRRAGGRDRMPGHVPGHHQAAQGAREGARCRG